MNNNDLQILAIDNVREKYFHDLIQENANIQYDFLNILGIDNNQNTVDFIHEDQYINGIYADFTLTCNNEIRAIIECKAGDIGVTDYVRGIGQVLQYEYFFEKSVPHKGFNYHKNFNTLLVVPSTAFNNKNFNIANFKYPVTTYLIEINEISKIARRVQQSELDKLSNLESNNLTSISQYYIRDTRLFEIFMLLKYLCFLKLTGVTKVNRKDIETKMMLTNSINNNNWRNVWISLSSLNFIDSNNLPTKSGINYGNLDFSEFLLIIYKSYIKPYIDILMEYFSLNPSNINSRLTDIKLFIREKFLGKDVLFLTQSDTRYLSSWLNILRDDFGCIEFESRNPLRKFNYNPSILNDDYLLEKIKKHTKSKQYLNNLNTILKL